MAKDDYEIAGGMQFLDDTPDLRGQISKWRIAVIVLCVLVLALVIALVVVIVTLRNSDATTGNLQSSPQESHTDTTESEPDDCKLGLENINVSPPDVLTPFHDLTSQEMKNVRDFLYEQQDLNLVPTADIGVDKSYIFKIELQVPNKEQTLNYLDKDGNQPDREAAVTIFRGDMTVPQVQEYVVGPLPLPTYLNGPEIRPFKFRPFSGTEWVGYMIKIHIEVQTVAGELLMESYKGKLSGFCEERCLVLQINIPESSGTSGLPDSRRVWVTLYRMVEFISLHALDFQVLVDLTGNKADQFNIVQVVYGGQAFSSLQDLMKAYHENSINKTDVPFPVADENLFSTMNRRGKLFPEVDARPPLQFEPDGKRYSINGRHISYMGWQFHLRMSHAFGPQLFDIRYNGERIVYELSLQEIGVFYSGHNPVLRYADILDTISMLGIRSRALVAEADCPAHATYLSATFWTDSSEEASVTDRAFCVFEHNSETPLRRHHTRSIYEGNKFYEGMQDVVFIVRTIMTDSVTNYDYILDFIFHQNGAIEVKVISTGYILTSFSLPNEDKYGFRLGDTMIGNIHHHIFHLKVDMDIKGTSNRFETLNIVPDEVDNSKWASEPNARYHQTKLVKTLVRTEKEAALKYNFETPKYLTFYNNDSRSVYGVPRAYRLLMRGMSKQMIPEGEGQEPSVAWARYQMAVTKYKEDEKRSSSVYAIWDGADPVVDFQKFIDDNESIVDVDQVTWVSMGIHHIPHMEDLPATPTVGLELKFYLLPNNFFDEDPAIGSRDAIRIDPRDQSDIYKGLNINRYGRNNSRMCKPLPSKFDEEIQTDPDSMFDPV